MAQPRAPETFTRDELMALGADFLAERVEALYRRLRQASEDRTAMRGHKHASELMHEADIRASFREATDALSELRPLLAAGEHVLSHLRASASPMAPSLAGVAAAVADHAPALAEAVGALPDGDGAQHVRAALLALQRDLAELATVAGQLDEAAGPLAQLIAHAHRLEGMWRSMPAEQRDRLAAPDPAIKPDRAYHENV